MKVLPVRISPDAPRALNPQLLPDNVIDRKFDRSIYVKFSRSITPMVKSAILVGTYASSDKLGILFSEFRLSLVDRNGLTLRYERGIEVAIYLAIHSTETDTI